MFCNKGNVNILTALLLRTGITDMVVCPGSRNAVLVHNFHQLTLQHDNFNVFPVTDERSAGFVALGLSVARDCRPVAVCVTSGSALLGTLPAVAEAYYRHIPLLVISADRPARWVGQLDGQTLPQAEALQPYTKTFNLDETHSPDDDVWCRDKVCAALLQLQADGGRPAHINVPLTDPLFGFGTAALPDCRPIEEYTTATNTPALPPALATKLLSARLPALLIGQNDREWSDIVNELDSHNRLLVLPELIGNCAGSRRMALLEQRPELLQELAPDLVIHAGGNLVGKQVKLTLRHMTACSVVRIEPGRSLPDTFCHLDAVVRGNTADVFRALRRILPTGNAAVRNAKSRLSAAQNRTPAPNNDMQYRVMAALAERLSATSGKTPIAAVHLANSTIVRTAALCFDSGILPFRCNRGVNGIEGSLSAAVGHALGTVGLNLVLIGDLSFFYDQNALWNKALGRNLRIVLFNNGGGRIFHHLPGLEASPACKAYVAAAHHTSAQGIAASYGLEYIAARTEAEAVAAFGTLLSPGGQRPVLLEVLVEADVHPTETKPT